MPPWNLHSASGLARHSCKERKDTGVSACTSLFSPLADDQLILHHHGSYVSCLPFSIDTGAISSCIAPALLHPPPSVMGFDMGQLSSENVQSISQRLSTSADLTLPGQLTKSGEQPTVEKRQQYLEALLLRDPGVFLERHGEMLTQQERQAFQPLRGDYEVRAGWKGAVSTSAGETKGWVLLRNLRARQQACCMLLLVPTASARLPTGRLLFEAAGGPRRRPQA